MLRFVTAGESHGPAVVAVLEGLPHGLPVDEAFINAELKRRQGGYGRGGRMRIETDTVEFLSGVRGGKTLGSPLTMVVHNKDERLEKAPKVTKVRPGHADLAGCLKYGLHDARDVLERASARETTARVMVGAMCSTFLRQFGIRVFGHVRALGGIEVAAIDTTLANLDASTKRRDASPFYTVDNSRDDAMKAAVEAAKAAGDTLGGLVEALALGLPPGIGNHTQWDRKLDGQLAQACMSVQAI
ncbi:MAG: chorismate synthase, partial [Planctomycetes bacterium]|nr:chorismate synthase [Planctomycetota bacterium]